MDWLKGFRREFFVLHLLRREQPKERIAKQKRIFALIKAPLEFLKVTVQMLRAHLMVRADNRALEQRPYALDAVGVNISTNPFFRAVIDAMVFGIRVFDPEVTGVIVGVDFAGFRVNRFRYEAVKGFPVAPLLLLLNAKPDRTAALECPENHRFVSEVAASNVAALPADVGFVAFDRSTLAADRRGVYFGHSLADAVAEVPGSLICYFDRAAQLSGANTLLGFAHQVHGKEPLPRAAYAYR